MQLLLYLTICFYSGRVRLCNFTSIMFRSKNEELITYILAIIAVNVIFLYTRTLVPGSGALTIIWIVAGIGQLVTLVPKIIANLKSR